MSKTSIEWTDASWNPIVGCTEISPGCANCYAARLAATRLRNTPEYNKLAAIENPGQARWSGEVRFFESRLREPLHWRKPRKIFVCDMGDLFHENVDHCEIWRVFEIIQRCPQHIFQVLTKRADRMRAFIASWCASRSFLPNVWLGVSVENQHFADVRIPLLLSTPAMVHWISAEPLLGPVNLELQPLARGRWGPLTTGLKWVVCGGESGPGARPMHPDWARSLRDQSQAAGVSFFFKQWGAFEQGVKEWGNNKKRAGRLLDGREWNEFPLVNV